MELPPKDREDTQQQRRRKAQNVNQGIIKMAGRLVVEDHPKEAAGAERGRRREGGIDVTRRKKSKKNKGPLGRDVTDKLDMLIEQYGSKYSQQSTVRTDGVKQGSRKLRKWFQT
ncbi:unnamed protein product [Prunus armeniaca]|uniref:Uncharacterized protein n=1 Tax=Prunus armeniaca TaxID=36596 RepID=A0A6J5Y7I4_PRUAR|nr:unnamed protein product [Prunus armeniaca]